MSKIKRKFKGVWLFFKKEERKIVSLLFVLSKILLSLLMVLIVPLAYFLISLYIRPRNLPQVNNYIKDQILAKYSDITFSFENSKLGFNSSWNFTYNIDDVSIKILDTEDRVKFANAVIEFDFFSLLLKKIKIDNITVSNSNFDLGETIKKDKLKPDIEEFDTSSILEIIYKIKDKIEKLKLTVRRVTIQDSTINFSTNGLKKRVDIIVSDVAVAFKANYVDLQISNRFNINKNSKDVDLNLSCIIFEKKKIYCDSNFANINYLDISNILKDYFDIIDKNKDNFNLNLSGSAKVLFDKNNALKELNYNIFSSSGSFYLKQFFTERINFENLFISGGIKDNFDHIYIESLKTKFDKTKFSMSMDIGKTKKGFDTHMRFDAKNVPIDNLSKLWPTFLGENGIRKWVIEHISDGVVPTAYADMDMVYDKELDKTTLTRIDSDVYIVDATLNYSESFPHISNINGMANFTKDNMDIRFDSSKILESEVSGNIKSDFTKDVKYLNIIGKAKGKPKDLFAHVNNNEENSSKVINSFFNGNTFSLINLEFPINKDIKLRDFYIEIKSNIKNNTTKYLGDNSNIDFLLHKEPNSNILKGDLDFKHSNIYIPYLGLNKKKNISTSVLFELLVDDSGVELVNIEPKNSKINFKASGKILKGSKAKSIQVNDIKYNNFDYNIYYNNVLIDGLDRDVLTLVSSKFDLAKLIDSFADSRSGGNGDLSLGGFGNFIFQANFDKMLLKNDKFLSNVNSELKCENDICHTFNLEGFINEANKKELEISMITKNLKKPNKKRVKIFVDDCGYIIDGLNISNKLINGKGQIKGDLYLEKDETIFKGDVEITNRFDVIINNDFSTKVTDNLLRRDVLPELRKKILENNISFDKMKSDFKLTNYKLEIRNMLLSTYNLVGIGITMSGDLYLDSGKMNLNGLIIPAEMINSLFGLGKLPVLSSIIDSGVFASPYILKKEGYGKESSFELQKKLTVLPGALRNLFKDKD